MKKIKYFLVGLLLISCSKSVVTPTPVELTNRIDSQTVKTPQQTTGIEIVPVDPRLTSTNKGGITVPVVVINYLPTTDGVYLDTLRTLNPNVAHNSGHILSLVRAKDKILNDKIIEKRLIEEGTKFRDYGKNMTNPYVSINVVAYINVYDLKYIKVGTVTADTTTNDNDDHINNPVTFNWYHIDFNDLLTRINLKHYVEDLGVKEVWFTNFAKELGVNSYNVQESNMSPSLKSTDQTNVSNGGGDLNLLPRYNSTYVIYGQGGYRGVDTDLHNRGHQIERQLEYVDNSNVYWGYFAKNRQSLGGLTHTPINTTTQYDYNNTTIVSSDFMNWKPSGGTKTNINNITWLNKTYSFSNQMVSPGPFSTGNNDYNQDPQTKWFIYWWQSIPGYNNNITDTLGSGSFAKKITLTNWWDIIYNWDSTITNKTRLIK